MKVLVFIEKSNVRGGIEVFAERHIAELRAAGKEVEVASALGSTPDAFAPFDEVVIHKCSDVATLESFPPEKTVFYVHDHEPICPRSYAYTPFGKNCSRSGGLWPCILCAPACRNWKNALKRVFAEKRRIAAMKRFGKIVVISQFMKSRLIANGLDAGRIEVLPPVIKCGAQGFSASPGGAGLPRPVDLLYVGQLIRGKGVHLLLKAMSKMKTSRTLDIVGTGNMEPKLKALAERLGLADRVHFNGFQSNPQEWMLGAACVVVPSFWQEPYGLAAAEAVALGRKVVAFAIGGLPEACQGKATLVPPGDVNALAAALDGQERRD